MTAVRRQVHDLAPGIRWCAVASYAGGSGLPGIYGPYPTEDFAKDAAGQLRAAGVHPDHSWQIEPLRLIDLGATND